MKKLIIIQTTTPDYRAEFYSTLKNSLGDAFELYAGNVYFESSVKSDPKIPTNHLKNYFFLKRKALFQTGHWHLLFKDDIVVLELNPRILSNWIFLLLRKVSGYKTVLWGHAWPRKGQFSKSDKLRNLMRNLATTIVVYTNKQREELQELMPNKNIYAAPNALMSAAKMEVPLTNVQPQHLLYVGRLTKSKKVLFLVKSFASVYEVLPEGTKLFVVGEGEERKEIETYIKENHLEERIILKGHISDFEQLKNLYSEAIFSISPGYAGLSITQSFGFGVPILISENENHSPEIEAVRLNKNAFFYKTDDVEDFKKRLNDIYSHRAFWLSQRQEIAAFCKEHYSVEAMAKIFTNLTRE